MNTRMNKRSQIGSFALEAAFVMLAMAGVGLGFWVMVPGVLLGEDGICGTPDPVPLVINTPGVTVNSEISATGGDGILGIVRLAVCHGQYDATFEQIVKYTFNPL